MNISSVSSQMAASLYRSNIGQIFLSTAGRASEVVSTVVATFFPQYCDHFEEYVLSLLERSGVVLDVSSKESSGEDRLSTLPHNMQGMLLSFLALDGQLAVTSTCKAMLKLRSDDTDWRTRIKIRIVPKTEEELSKALSTTVKPGRGIALKLPPLAMDRGALVSILRQHIPAAGQIQSLTINIQGFTEDHFACFEHLTALSALSVTASDPASLQSLAACKHLQNLTSLNLSGNGIGVQGAKLVANSVHLRRLTSLNLCGNGIGSDGAIALANSAHLSGLISLNLSSNSIGPVGAEALANSACLSSLASLVLYENGIGPAGAEALASSKYLSRLTRLMLSSNNIGSDGASSLANSAFLSSLTKFDLSDNNIGSDGAEALANSEYLIHLTFLGLSNNGIDSVGAEALANSENLSCLKRLNIGGNLAIYMNTLDFLRDRFPNAKVVFA